MIKYILIIVLFPIISCGSIHKIFNKKKETIDSTAAMKSDTAQAKYVDSTSTHESLEMHGSDVEVELDDTGAVIKLPIGISTVKGYFDSITYNRWTGTLTSNRPIKSVKFHFDDSIAMNDSTAMIRAETLHIVHTDSVHISKKETDISKEVIKTGLTLVQKILIGFGLLILIALIILYKYRKQLLKL